MLNLIGDLLQVVGDAEEDEDGRRRGTVILS